jgi:hypothetical protein
MSLSNILNQSIMGPNNVPWANIDVNDLNANAISSTIPLSFNLLQVNTIQGNAVPTLVDVNASLVPSIDATYNLGSSSHKWNNLYVDNFGVATESVDVIKGLTTEDVSIDLQTAGHLYVGTTSAPQQIGFGSDGSIVTESATSALIVADGAGAQITVQPSQITAVQALEIVGNSGLTLVTNTGDTTIASAGNVDLSPVGFVMANSQIQTNVGGAAYASAADPTSGFGAQSSAANLIANGSVIVSAQAGNVTVNQPIYTSVTGTPQYSSGSDSSSGLTVGVFSSKLSSGGVDNVVGSRTTLALTPLTDVNNSIAITDPEYLGVDQSGVLSFYKPYNVYVGSPYTAPVGEGVYPCDFNGMGGGFSQGIYYDSSYTIKKVAICMNINSGTYSFGGGTASLEVGHYVVNAAQTSFVVDYTLALNTSGSFWQQSSGNISVPVTGPVNMAVQLALAGGTPVGVPNSLSVSLMIEGN